MSDVFVPRHLLDTSQHLYLSRSSCMHYFSHVLQLSFILSSIETCFITFMHLYGFLVPPWSSLIIFMFLGWSFIVSYTLCQSWQKGGEIVENMWFLSKILRVLGVLTSFFLYTSLVTMFTYIVLIFDDVCLLHLSLHVLFLFYLYTHVSTCMQFIISVSHKDALMSFV